MIFLYESEKHRIVSDDIKLLMEVIGVWKKILTLVDFFDPRSILFGLLLSLQISIFYALISK